MATIFSDNFSEYTPGSTSVTGFFAYGAMEILDFGTMTGTTLAPGFFENTGQGVQVFGTMAHQETSVYDATLVVWEGFSFGSADAPMVVVGNANLGTSTGTAAPVSIIGGLILNSDYTVSFYVTSTSSGGSPYSGGYYIATTEEQVVYPYAWQYYQAEFVFGMATTTNLGTVLTVTCTFSVEGTTVLTGTATTGLVVSNLYLGSAGCNQWDFSSGYLANITGYVDSGSGLPTFNTWPNPSTPDAYVTQGVVELNAFNPSVGRVTQGVVEIPTMPTLRYARITQGVVEIVGRLTRAGGWMVYEV